MAGGDDPTLEQLVNQIAHDIRNDAFSIGLQAELGQRRAADLPEVRAHFDAIVGQVDALRRYLDQLLLYGRPVAIDARGLDPAALITGEVELVRTTRGASQPLDIRVKAGRLPQARWDARLLRHALRALLDNAVESATPPPPIAVAVRNVGDNAEIEVRDSGPGIPSEVLQRIGVPMATRRTGRAGLGLAIARKIAQAHGGRLEIESGPAGTTARLVVPWEAPHA